MTEAMSHREIEDVLSSIKRLVSQETQHRAPAEPRHEKLVLTSALRVLPETGPAAEDAPEAVEDAATADNPAAATGPEGASAAEPQIPAPEAAHQAETVLPPSLIRRIAQAGAIPDAAPGMVPETPETHDRQETGFDAFAPAPADSQPDPLPLEDAALEATLARLEAALSGKPAPEPAPSADQGSAERPAPDAQGRTETDQIIDEGMLYQLVAHIVRQELQGELGEKITRNIRKLVRQEVAREMQLRRD